MPSNNVIFINTGLREYVDATNSSVAKLPSAYKHKCLVCDKMSDPVSALQQLEVDADPRPDPILLLFIWTLLHQPRVLI